MPRWKHDNMDKVPPWLAWHVTRDVTGAWQSSQVAVVIWWLSLRWLQHNNRSLWHQAARATDTTSASPGRNIYWKIFKYSLSKCSHGDSSSRQVAPCINNCRNRNNAVAVSLFSRQRSACSALWKCFGPYLNKAPVRIDIFNLNEWQGESCKIQLSKIFDLELPDEFRHNRSPQFHNFFPDLQPAFPMCSVRTNFVSVTDDYCSTKTEAGFTLKRRKRLAPKSTSLSTKIYSCLHLFRASIMTISA